MKLRLCWLLALGSVLLSGAAEPDGLLVSESYTHQLSDSDVRTAIQLSASDDPQISSRRLLTVRVSAELDDADARAAVLNGLVLLALPDGAELVGSPRLFYLDDAGERQPMYSRPLPAVGYIDQLDDAQDLAVSGSGEERLAALSELSLALDPDLSVAGPADPRLRGEDGYTVHAFSWLLPSTMAAQRLVNPFAPDDSLQQATTLELQVPVAFSNANASSAVVYVGALSTASVEAELPVEELPETALPLEPLPEPDETEPEIEGESEADQVIPGSELTDLSPEEVDELLEEAATADADAESTEESEAAEAPAAEPEIAEAPEEPAEPELIEAVLLSYKWVSWEGEVAAEQLTPSTVKPRSRFATPKPPAVPDPSALYPEEDEPVLAEPADPDEDTAPVEPAPQAREPRPILEKTNEAATTVEAPQAAEPTPAAVEHGGAVREVAPGTLPVEADVYRVPLKAITNRQPVGSMPGQPGVPDPFANAAPAPADLGEMILIPAGPFEMGTSVGPLAENADEAPQHEVVLAAFQIDKYPVTNRKFYEFVIQAGYKAEGNWERYFEPATADLPVRGVSWADAAAYAKWAGKRLPTEAEWEKAARGDDARIYPWGNDWSSAIMPRDDAVYALVNSVKIASPYGVMATCGVLWQWTASNYAAYPFNPKAAGSKKVLRGGAFSNGRNVVRCANRYAEVPSLALNTFTFRCASDVSE